MGNRRRARELALACLYRADLLERWEGACVEAPLGSWSDDEAVVEFARRLLRGVRDHRGRIDAVVQAHADHWTIPRMNIVDRNIMRMAAYEILFCEDIPKKVSIYEAIELAKRYSSKDAGSFLNGILDRIEGSGSPHG